MEPPAHPHHPRSTEAITVAELLARYKGVPVPPPPRRAGDDAVSVAELLRREGHGPHRADRPLLPRGHTRVPEAPPPPPRRNVRKAAAAAGALFAATAVLGPSVLDDASGRMSPWAGNGVPQPLTDLPGGSTSTSSVRQVFADALPSEVDSRVADGAAPERIGPIAQPSVRGRTGAGSTPGPAEPGVAGTPPAGTWNPGGPGTTPAAPAPGGGHPVPGGGGPAAPGHRGGNAPADTPPGAAAGPGTVVAVSPPTVNTPTVTVPGAGLDLPVVGPVRAPEVTLGPAVVTPPALRATIGEDGLAATTTPAEIGLPDLTVTDTRLGPVGASGTSVTTPDVELSGARLSLSADAPPEVALPGVDVSGTRIETPDLTLGPVTAALPDVELPALQLGGSDRVEDEATDTAEPSGSGERDDGAAATDEPAGTADSTGKADTETRPETDTETDTETETETESSTEAESSTADDTGEDDDPGDNAVGEGDDEPTSAADTGGDDE